MNYIKFNQPYLSGKELEYIAEAHLNAQLSGDGPFTKYCSTWLEQHLKAKKSLITHSCTAALEMSAMLADINIGDEVIMPSYTFVSTANAFVLRGAVPVFVDINEKTLNIDENLIEIAITKKTKAIVVVHYAGVSCAMDEIFSIASKYGLIVIEDAAQAIQSKYKGKPLGTLGNLGCLSFHETKNIISGEGGAILLNEDKYIKKAEIIREKGTDRSKFFRGEVDKYTWQDMGSSLLPGEIICAFLKSQLENSHLILNQRMRIWSYYETLFNECKDDDLFQTPYIPSYCTHNAHMFYLLLNEKINRNDFINRMKINGIGCVSHYVPLHDSPAGKKFSRHNGTMEVTDSIAKRIVRIPLHMAITEYDQCRIVQNVNNICKDLMYVN